MTLCHATFKLSTPRTNHWPSPSPSLQPVMSDESNQSKQSKQSDKPDKPEKSIHASSDKLPPPFSDHRQPAKHDGSRAPTLRIGEADLQMPGHPVRDIDEEGMLVGPHHPIFRQSEKDAASDVSLRRIPPSRLPSDAVPPGARFDPITPLAPTYGSGEPDNDELLPPGEPGFPIAGARPDGKRSPNDGGHPFGAPPGSGNPPFFM